MSTLREIQYRFGAAVMHPLTAKDETPRKLTGEAEAIIKPNDRLTSVERLEIYSRSYWYRVLDSLVEDFPGVRAIASVREFHAMSRDYLTQHPSTSFTLRNLGSHFVEWLEKNARRVHPHERLALDMAHLEWAHIEVFDAAEMPVITPEAWARAGEAAVLKLQPYIRLVAAEYAVDDLLLEVRKVEDSNRKIANWHRKSLPRIQRDKAFIVLHRVEYSVCYRRVTHEGFRLLQALQEGKPLGEALEFAFHGSKLPEDSWPALVQEWFGSWMSLGWFSA
ncbi:MAG TPA: DNA-binding domain-containing protein [Candidatus Koribacter sp.]|jgi:hypothetical protein